MDDISDVKGNTVIMLLIIMITGGPASPLLPGRPLRPSRPGSP